MEKKWLDQYDMQFGGISAYIEGKGLGLSGQDKSRFDTLFYTDECVI